MESEKDFGLKNFDKWDQKAFLRESCASLHGGEESTPTCWFILVYLGLDKLSHLEQGERSKHIHEFNTSVGRKDNNFKEISTKEALC